MPHRIPLGLLLLSRGHLSDSQLRSALAIQEASGYGRIGHWLEELGYVTEYQVMGALASQWACPVLARPGYDVASASLLPMALMVASGLMPISFVPTTRKLYLGFSNDIDYGALNAIDEMLGCRTQACLVSRSTVAEFLERVQNEARPVEVSFENVENADEVSRITSGYAFALGSEESRMVACGAYAWVRLEGRGEPTHLLFRHAAVSPKRLAPMPRQFPAQLAKVRPRACR